MQSTLDVQSLSRVFRMGSRELGVLREVSFSVRKKELVAVMGQSGSGKSTLLHIISGLLPATSGMIQFAGAEVTGLPERERAKFRRKAIGYVFQNFNLMPHLTAEDNVTLPLRVNGLAVGAYKDRVDRLMEAMELTERRRHRPHQLSGGELQRTSIARALVIEPDLLLADEPTGNLSTRAGEEVMGLLRRAVDEEGRSVLLVTHNPYDAARADRVLFLKDGRTDSSWEIPEGKVDVAAVLDRLKELGI